MQGKALSSGIGIGTALVYTEPTIAYSKITNADPAAEMARFDQAVVAFVSAAESKMQGVSEEQAAVLDAHNTFAQDPEIRSGVEGTLEAKHCNSEEAIEIVFNRSIEMFEAFEDEMWRERARDLKDIRDALLRRLLGIETPDLSGIPTGTVLIAHELTPSVTAGLDASRVAAFVIEVGGVTSHTAILARSLEIPAVAHESALESINDGDPLIVDGNTGLITVHPDAAALESAQKSQQQAREKAALLRELVGKTSQTADGKILDVFCNIGQPADCERALENDAEGIGLFRTEFLYMEHDSLPSEDMQFDAYKQVVTAFAGKTVIFRTMDVGGDKDIPYLNLAKEENPFLGFRAIRHSLVYQDVFLTQLRALLRASAFGDAWIMLPMISSIHELRDAKALVEKAKESLRNENVAFNENIRVGIMIETPAAALTADSLAKEADFFSVGTNDLTQYTTAVDRGNERVAALYSPYHPAVLRLIQMAARAANEANIPMGMCGEAAAEEALIPVWIGLGLNELSVSAPRVLATRARILSIDSARAKAIADKALALPSAVDVCEYLQSEMNS